MKRPLFIGRKTELKQLKRQFEKRTASLIVVKGRRRIGKSRLIEEFGKHYKFYELVGLATNRKTASSECSDKTMGC